MTTAPGIENRDKNDLQGRWTAGMLLLLQFIVFVGLLIWRLLVPSLWIPASIHADNAVQVNEAIVMALAGCAGSLVSSLQAFFEHACQKKDFERSYVPWYLFWQILGFVLALIFYFTVKGGILFVTSNDAAMKTDTLNIWSLAAIGALVGLFSRDAIKKLKEVFNNIFITKTEIVETQKESNTNTNTNTNSPQEP